MRKPKRSLPLFPLLILSFLPICFTGCSKSLKSEKTQIFEPGNISTELVEYASCFSPTGSEIYFARSMGQWGTMGMKSSIFYSKKEGHKWSKPKLASFSGSYDDSAPHISNDGKTLYFISDRPSEEIQAISQDIWMVEKTEEGIWGEPVRMGHPINSLGNEYGVCTDGQGNLFFASDREGGLGQGDLYLAKRKNRGYLPPINLGSTINSKMGEWNLEVSQDGEILIFEASQRAQNLSSYGDLYISFKKENQWSQPQNIQEINTTGSDLYAELYDNQDVLFYSSSDSLKSTKTNIYFIDFKAIKKKYEMNAVFSK